MEIIMFINLLHFSTVALNSDQSGNGAVLWNLYTFVCGYVNNDTARSIILLASVLLCIASAYLLGSINPAIIISKKLYNEDIRSFGSGNAGATNTFRTYGKKMAILIFSLDFLKAIVAVVIGSLLLSVNVGGAISALFVVLGHMFPVFYKFKGGKGVACTAACILILSPISFAVLLVIFILIVLFTKYVSLASIMCAMLFPLLAFSLKDVFWGGGGFITLSSLLIAGFVVFMHRENIKRLLEGKESKFYLSQKHKDEKEKGDAKVEKTESAPARKYSNDDFITCTCGRVIPKTRKECVYCGEKNPYFIPSDNTNKKRKKKK